MNTIIDARTPACEPRCSRAAALALRRCGPGRRPDLVKACAKDGEFLIGFSQANNAEPYRQHVNDELTAAAKEVPQFTLQIADGAGNVNTQTSPGRQLHHPEGRSAADLAVRGGAADAGGQAGDGRRHPGDRARPQDGRRSRQGLHGLHRRRQLQDRRGGGQVHRQDAAAGRRRGRGAAGPAELDAGGRAAERLQGRRQGERRRSRSSPSRPPTGCRTRRRPPSPRCCRRIPTSRWSMPATT